jgi:hypothetical protein
VSFFLIFKRSAQERFKRGFIAAHSKTLSLNWRYFKKGLFFACVRLSAYIVTLLGGILSLYPDHGISGLSWDFITKLRRTQ